MPLQCPECPNNKSFSAIGQKGKMQCFKCGITLDIEKNWRDN